MLSIFPGCEKEFLEPPKENGLYYEPGLTQSELKLTDVSDILITSFTVHNTFIFPTDSAFWMTDINGSSRDDITLPSPLLDLRLKFYHDGTLLGVTSMNINIGSTSNPCPSIETLASPILIEMDALEGDDNYIKIEVWHNTSTYIASYSLYASRLFFMQEYNLTNIYLKNNVFIMSIQIQFV